MIRPGAGSVLWRVNREPALLLGGGRALLMQLAHPKVAAGVAEHSDFDRRPLRRLANTLDLSLTLVFGSDEEAGAAARRINRRHQDVRGAGYSARDPDLLLWVHATLIDTALVVYERFIAPLGAVDRECYYSECKQVGHLLGISNQVYPAGWEDFELYMEQMVAELAVGEPARRLAHQVLRYGPPFRLVTAGLLPTRLRSAFGLGWGPRRQQAFDLTEATVRRLLPALPEALRVVPAARVHH